MKTSQGYTSILIIHRLEVTQICANGLPLGDIIDGTFKPDPLFLHRNPFQTEAELREFVAGVASKIIVLDEMTHEEVENAMSLPRELWNEPPKDL